MQFNILTTRKLLVQVRVHWHCVCVCSRVIAYIYRHLPFTLFSKGVGLIQTPQYPCLGNTCFKKIRKNEGVSDALRTNEKKKTNTQVNRSSSLNFR